MSSLLCLLRATGLGFQFFVQRGIMFACSSLFSSSGFASTPTNQAKEGVTSLNIKVQSSNHSSSVNGYLYNIPVVNQLLDIFQHILSFHTDLAVVMYLQQGEARNAGMRKFTTEKKH